jgi:hypothetical protein
MSLSGKCTGRLQCSPHQLKKGQPTPLFPPKRPSVPLFKPIKGAAFLKKMFIIFFRK